MRRQSASFSTGPRSWNANEVRIEEGWTRAMPLTVGARLGPYEVVAAIGSGGMGEGRAMRGIAVVRLRIAD